MQGSRVPFIGTIIKTILLTIVCIALGSCTQLTDKRNGTQVVVNETPVVTETPAPATTLEFITTPITTPNPTPTLLKVIRSGSPWTTVTVPRPNKPSFGTLPVGKMLVMQYTEVFSRPAYSKYYIPFYGALDSVVWEISSVSAPRKRLDDGRDKVRLKVSPDGTKVAYIVNGKDGEYNGIWMAGVDGSNPQELTPRYFDEDYMHHVGLVGWSADSRKIAYCEFYVSWGGWLYIIDVPSKQIARMDIKPIEYVYSPRWIPGSSHLMALYDDVGDLRFLNINTQEVITKETTSCSTACPQRGFLPDGTGKYEITKEGVLAEYALDGSQLYRVTLEGLTTYSDRFTWSPNGKWFVYMVEDENHLNNIYKMNRDNRTPQLVLKGSQVSPTSHEILKMGLSNFKLFSWSPDGQWFVVFNSLGKTGAGELYVINVETNEVRTVMTLSPFAPMRDGIGFVSWFAP